jgi:hypothetical protein
MNYTGCSVLRAPASLPPFGFRGAPSPLHPHGGAHLVYFVQLHASMSWTKYTGAVINLYHIDANITTSSFLTTYNTVIAFTNDIYYCPAIKHFIFIIYFLRR